MCDELLGDNDLTIAKRSVARIFIFVHFQYLFLFVYELKIPIHFSIHQPNQHAAMYVIQMIMKNG